MKQTNAEGCLFAVLKLFGIQPPQPDAAPPDDSPYECRPSFLTKAEASFYRVLGQAVGNRFEIFAMVRVADILKVRSDTEKRQTYVNQITSKHVDFVLCDPTSLKIVAAIELDDSTHQRKGRQKRDEFLNRAFAAAGLPLIRIKTSQTYNTQSLSDMINSAVQTTNSMDSAPQLDT